MNDQAVIQTTLVGEKRKLRNLEPAENNNSTLAVWYGNNTLAESARVEYRGFQLLIYYYETEIARMDLDKQDWMTTDYLIELLTREGWA
jgi:hypothetical protein